MGTDLKYNVSQATQEEVPIDIKDVTNLNNNDEVLDNLNTSSQVETPLRSKENDDLEQDNSCYTINLILRASSFNTTLNTREVCGADTGFNIEVPLSRYMRDTQIELIFMWVYLNFVHSGVDSNESLFELHFTGIKNGE